MFSVRWVLGSHVAWLAAVPVYKAPPVAVDLLPRSRQIGCLPANRFPTEAFSSCSCSAICGRHLWAVLRDGERDHSGLRRSRRAAPVSASVTCEAPENQRSQFDVGHHGSGVPFGIRPLCARRAWVPSRAAVAIAPGGSGWTPALLRQGDWSSRFFAGVLSSGPNCRRAVLSLAGFLLYHTSSTPGAA